MSSLGADPTTALRCNSPASLKEYPGTLARSGSQARSFLMWPRPLTPYGSTTLSTNSGPQLSLVPGENHFILLAWSDIWSFLPRIYFLSPWHVGWHSAGWINLPFSLQSVCQWHAYPHDVELAIYVDNTAIIATSRKEHRPRDVDLHFAQVSTLSLFGWLVGWLAFPLIWVTVSCDIVVYEFDSRKTKIDWNFLMCLLLR
jgi:hypothetical protein